MKPAPVFLTAVTLLSLLCAGSVFCASAAEADLHDEILGDYLFDQRNARMVFLYTIYEEDGALYALTDIADYPVELRPVASEERTFRIKYKRAGDFNLKFTRLEDGVCSELQMRSNTSDWAAGGKRVEPELGRLRERYRETPDFYVYRKPMALNDGWETTPIRETGIDTTLLYAMMTDIYENREYMHSVLIVKDGRLVFEEYMNGWDPARLHRAQSVTKSFTSTVVGLAIEQGLIADIDDPLRQYLPEYSSLFDYSKNKVSIRHLLTMSAGFDWNEAETYYNDPSRCDAHIAEAGDDYVRYLLEKPIVTEPGTFWYYNSGYPNILGYIVEKTSGKNITEFAYEHLFEPLGIKRCCWMATTGENRPGCAGGLRLTSRDLARYGQLYLNKGVWQGVRVVSERWVEESVKRRMDAEQGTGYGYLWKSISAGGHEIFFASGTGGQYVACVPDVNVVVVTTAIYKTDKGDEVAAMLLKYVVPAL